MLRITIKSCHDFVSQRNSRKLKPTKSGSLVQIISMNGKMRLVNKLLCFEYFKTLNKMKDKKDLFEISSN